jgi:hypothetical protein
MAPLVFVAGNHEDFIYLDERRQLVADAGPVSIDAYQQIHWLPWATTWTFAVRGCELRIAGLGGLPKLSRARTRLCNAPSDT